MRERWRCARYLGLVISKLSAAPAETSHAHGAFRHSKLTMLLRNALLGNSKATRRSYTYGRGAVRASPDHCWLTERAAWICS